MTLFLRRLFARRKPARVDAPHRAEGDRPAHRRAANRSPAGTGPDARPWPDAATAFSTLVHEGLVPKVEIPPLPQIQIPALVPEIQIPALVPAGRGTATRHVHLLTVIRYDGLTGVTCARGQT